MNQSLRSTLQFGLFLVAGSLCFLSSLSAEEESLEQLGVRYKAHVRPLLERYCFECHSGAKAKGDANLESFTTAKSIGGEARLWLAVAEQLRESGMPPKKKAQPSLTERAELVEWIEQYLDRDARSRAGDPGLVLMRRLTNAEFDYTIRDLTGVEVSLTEKFPEDSVAGEGFANTGESLIMAPPLLQRYLDAARSVAARAVLTPTGFRFSGMADRHEWIAEAMVRLQKFYRRYAGPEGQIPLGRYIEATLRYRDRAADENISPESLAAADGLSVKYLRTLLRAFFDPMPSPDVASLVKAWRSLRPGESRRLVDEIVALQAKRWKLNDQKGFQIYSVGLYGAYVVPFEPKDEKKAAPGKTAPLQRRGPNGRAGFDNLFPLAVCFPDVAPVNNDVTVQLFHREDDALRVLFLNDREVEELEQLWGEFLYVSRALIDEAYNMREFIEFQPAGRHENSAKLAAMLPELDRKAEDYKKALVAAERRHVEALVDFARRAWRRPLEPGEDDELRGYYAALREREALSHDDAFRTALARILVSPRFLYRVERPREGGRAVPISAWELASRLSYFLWSSLPDSELN
ncbi:MAG: DUF1587 domain-containing protein, partial [Planctomycetes bacterium]|nr:DUF1587 domain-containing protein [Planctomycetota bacterium]